MIFCYCLFLNSWEENELINEPKRPGNNIWNFEKNPRKIRLKIQSEKKNKASFSRHSLKRKIKSELRLKRRQEELSSNRSNYTALDITQPKISNSERTADEPIWVARNCTDMIPVLIGIRRKKTDPTPYFLSSSWNVRNNKAISFGFKL